MDSIDHRNSTHWFSSSYLTTVPVNDRKNLQIFVSFSTAVCIFGVLGNTLCAAVLTKMIKHNTKVRLLKYLALVDIVILLCLFLSIFVIGLQLEFMTVLYVICDPFAYLCGITIYTFEIYLTIFIAVERCIAVALPLRFLAYKRDGLINTILWSTFLFSVIFNIPNWLAYRPHLYWNDDYNMPLFTAVNTPFFSSYGYSVYRKYVTLVFRCVVPVVILIVCNVILVISRRKASNEIGQTVARNGSDRLTLVVVAITLGSLITHVTSAANLIIENELPEAVDAYVSLTDATVIALNSSTNFIFYCFFGTEFRRTFVSMFRKCKHENTLDNTVPDFSCA